MNILITGATGFVGQHLVQALKAEDNKIIILSRNASKAQAQFPFARCISYLNESDDAIDVAINLAGENVASGRWNAARKKRMYDSRVKGTQALVAHLKALPQAPKLLINASGIGFYGNTEDKLVNEDTTAGTDFLASICQDWEKAAKKIADESTRVVLLRIGMVLGNGGALAKMRTPFSLGLGGNLGKGQQYISWIHIHDLIAAILHSIENESVQGPVNCCSPNPVANREFTKVLGKVLKRPTFMAVPAFALKLLFGEMSDILLYGQRAHPQALLDTGFSFSYEDCEAAVRQALTGK